MKHLKTYGEKVSEGVGQRDIDAILDKVAAGGMDSLTAKERAMLDNVDNPVFDPDRFVLVGEDPSDGNADFRFEDDHGVIEASDAEFDLAYEEDNDANLMMWVDSLSMDDCDDICSVRHPDFDAIWNNSTENVFELNAENEFGVRTMEDARKWCESIGMTFSPGLAGTIGG